MFLSNFVCSPPTSHSGPNSSSSSSAATITIAFTEISPSLTVTGIEVFNSVYDDDLSRQPPPTHKLSAEQPEGIRLNEGSGNGAHYRPIVLFYRKF